MSDGGAAQSGRARRGGGASQNGRRGRLRAPDAAAPAAEPLKEKPWGVAASLRLLGTERRAVGRPEPC